MDFERIRLLLEVWDRTRQMPSLSFIAKAALDELTQINDYPPERVVDPIDELAAAEEPELPIEGSRRL